MPLDTQKSARESNLVMPDASAAGTGSKLDPVAAALKVLREYESAYGADDVPPVPVEDIAESHLDLLIEECDDVRAMPGAPQDQGRLSGMLDPEAPHLAGPHRVPALARTPALHHRARVRALGAARARS